jgi:hypothetical protein
MGQCGGLPPPPEPAVEAALREVAAQAEAAVAACDGVAVTIARQGKPTGAVFSSEVVREVDSVQYEHEVGPCLDAIRQLQVFRVDFLPEARSWPEFSRTAQRRHEAELALRAARSLEGTGSAMSASDRP